jgi:hypothetical protein
MKQAANGAPWTFCVDYAGGHTKCLADALSLTPGGNVQLWLREKLVGVFRSGEWLRVYLIAVDVPDPEAHD